jgi:hypothetical protein
MPSRKMSAFDMSNTPTRSTLLQNGPDNSVIVDTGGPDKFDRLLFHNRKQVDALGYPVVKGLRSKGLYWGDGNVQVR